MPPRPHVLAETSWKTVRSTQYEVAILPWGATEAHNLHLPYATDTLECDALAAESARLARDAGARVIVLPTVPFGVNTGQLDIPLCLNMNPSTQASVLADVVASIEGQGIRKLVLFNGHGGNDFRQMIRELQPRTAVFLCTLNWWQCIDPRPFFADPGDHGGELETGVMMALYPDLVLPPSDAGPGRARRFRIPALREGWVWTPRQWTKVTTDTGVGDPRAATAEQGRRYVAAVTERIAGFLVDLDRADPDDLYE